MRIDTAGQKGNPVIIMLNGSFTTGRPLQRFAQQYLAEDYYVICPTWDGHDEEGGVFDTRAGQAKKILAWLKDNAITEVALLQGLSMGAEVAVELTRQIRDDDAVIVRRCFCDGGPFFAFPTPFRSLMYMKFRNFIHLGKNGQTEKLMNNRMIKWMVHGDIEPYREMMGDLPVDVLTDETIRNESDACYTFDFPAFSREEQRKMVFSWSTDEPARKSAKKIKRAYPYAAYKSPGAMGHGGFILRDPEKYAAVMRKLAGKESR